MKNDFGGHDNNHYNNIYGYVGQAIGMYDAPMLDGHGDYFYNNSVILTGSHVGAGTCTGTGMTVLHDNKYFTNDGTVTECKMDLAAWQAKGNDKGSSVAKLPTDDAVVAMASALLGIKKL
jgi:hypothetical protein